MVRRLVTKSTAAVAADYGLSVRTVRKWKHRYAVGGSAALADASSRPKRCRCRLTSEDMTHIHELRLSRKTGDEIALLLDLHRSTVFRALRKLGLSRLASLEPKTPAQRYEWASPGDMLHVDIKRLGKIDGIGHRKAGTRQVKRRKPGGNTSMSAWMTLQGSHIPQSMRMRLRNPPWNSFGSQWRGISSTGSR